MNLKPFVASMFILGLASSPALASYNAENTQVQLDAMKSKIAKMESIINTNSAGNFQQPGWFNRINVSGQANIDFRAANRSPINFGLGADGVLRDQSAQDLTLNNANLFVDARVNSWTQVHVGLLYQDTNNFTRVLGLPVVPSSQFNPQISVNNFNSILDEAYVRIGDFERTPIYAQVGKQYIPFGDYKRFPMVVPFTQLLTESRQTAVTLGFVDGSGFNGAAYIFRGSPNVMNTAGGALTTSRVQNFGVNLGFANTNDKIGYKLSAGYLRNMADVKYINDRIGTGANSLSTNSYNSPVGALSVDGAIAIGAFDANAHYVTALQTFDARDVQYVSNGVAQAAKPRAWGVELGYGFKVIGDHQSRISVGYQASRQTGGIIGATTGRPVTVNGGLNIPKQRWVADYTMNVSKNADVGVAVYNDRDHNIGGTNRTATTGVLRLAVKFS
jgi:hypothetical protein